jgi:hypothetical protein
LKEDEKMRFVCVVVLDWCVFSNSTAQSSWRAELSFKTFASMLQHCGEMAEFLEEPAVLHNQAE